MNTLTVQTEKLRKSAYEVEGVKNNNADLLRHDGITLAVAAMRLRDAADTIADLRMQLTERTCHMVTDHDAFEVWQECDECGCMLPNPCTMPKIHYCPSCGRRVI